jgi:hypothetical protein
VGNIRDLPAKSEDGKTPVKPGCDLEENRIIYKYVRKA